MRTPSVSTVLKSLALANGLNACSDFSQLYSYCCVPRESMEYCETTLIPVLAVWAWCTMRYSHGTSAMTAGKFQSGRPRMRRFFRISEVHCTFPALPHTGVSWMSSCSNLYQQITCSCSFGAICVYCSLLQQSHHVCTIIHSLSSNYYHGIKCPVFNGSLEQVESNAEIWKLCGAVFPLLPVPRVCKNNGTQ